MPDRCSGRAWPLGFLLLPMSFDLATFIFSALVVRPLLLTEGDPRLALCPPTWVGGAGVLIMRDMRTRLSPASKPCMRAHVSSQIYLRVMISPCCPMSTLSRQSPSSSYSRSRCVRWTVCARRSLRGGIYVVGTRYLRDFLFTGIEAHIYTRKNLVSRCRLSPATLSLIFLLLVPKTLPLHTQRRASLRPSLPFQIILSSFFLGTDCLFPFRVFTCCRGRETVACCQSTEMPPASAPKRVLPTTQYPGRSKLP